MTPGEVVDQMSIRVRSMKSFLRTLATAEEAYFVEQAHYANRMVDLPIKLRQDISIVSLTVLPDGRSWSAIVTHARLPNVRCGVAIGTRNPLDESADEAVPFCR